MNFKTIPFFRVLTMLFVLSFFFFAMTYVAQAGKSDIQFPVAELGGCESKTDCFAFCESPDNYSACLSFAGQNDLLEDEEIEQGQAMIKAVESGNTPGGCKTGAECERYCSSVDTLDECVSFGEKHEFTDKKHKDESRKILKAIKSGAKLPGGCNNKDACEEYCSNGSHMQECNDFAIAAGFMSEEEVKEMERVLPLMQSGQSPGGCTSRESCDAYCDDENHLNECITFAKKAGFVSDEEAEMILKTGGKGPGGCKGKRECDTFCDNEANSGACVEFGIEHGLISPEDAENMRKTGGKGPGDCKGRQECESYCKNPNNQEVCFKFAKDHDLISEEDLSLIEKHRSGPGGCITTEACSDFCSQEQNKEECSKFGPGDRDRKGKEDDFFGKHKEFEGGEGKFEQSGFVGPGGCTTPEECADFCSIPENGPICTPGSEFKEFPHEEFDRERPEFEDRREFEDFDKMKMPRVDDENWKNKDGEFEDWENKPGNENDPRFFRRDGEFGDDRGEDFRPEFDRERPDEFRPEFDDKRREDFRPELDRERPEDSHPEFIDENREEFRPEERPEFRQEPRGEFEDNHI